MRKFVTAVLFFVTICMLFAGCGAQDAVLETKDVGLPAVRDAVLEGLNGGEPFLIETDALLNLYGIEPQWVDASAGFVMMNGTFPDEVIFVKAADEASKEEIREKLQNRLDEVLVQSKTYDAENYAAAQECSVTVDGPYLCLILSPQRDMIAEIYQSFFAPQ